MYIYIYIYIYIYLYIGITLFFDQVRKLRREKKYNVIAKKLCFLSTWC